MTDTHSHHVAPARLRFFGRVIAAGVSYRSDHLGAEEVERRIVTTYGTGDTVFRWKTFVFHLFHLPRPVDVDALAGHPLCPVANGVTDVPLSEKEVERLVTVSGALRDCIVVAVGGTCEVLHRSALEAIDPATWVDLGPIQWWTPDALVPPPPPLERGIPDVDLSKSSILKAGGKPSPDVVELFHSSSSSASTSTSPASSSSEPSKPGLFGRLFKGFDFGGSSTGRPPPTPTSEDSTWAPPGTPRAPSFFERLFGLGAGGGSEAAAPKSSPSSWTKALRDRATKKQAEYLEEMMKRFEGMDLDSALKHAIGLGEDTTPASSTGGFGGQFSPRSRLSLSRHGALGRTNIDAGQNLYEHLRALYRATYERCVAAGDIDRAAFILLELLGEVDETVRFLAAHDRFQEAAEIAQGRGLEDFRVAELLARAGQMRRALLIARRAGQEAAVATELERVAPAVARMFRLLWANVRAESGDYEAAIVALGALVDDHTGLAQKWIELGAAIGGASGARLLAHRLSDTFDVDAAFVDIAKDVIADQTLDGVRVRQQFASALLRHQGLGLDVVTDALARALVRDAAKMPAKRVSPLVASVGRRAQGVGADIPNIQPVVVPPLAHREWPLVADIDVRDLGGAACHDVVALPRNRLLVAHGPAGVHIVDAKTAAIKQRFPAQAVALVVSPRGDRALALSARRGAVQVWQLDLQTGATQRWRQFSLSAFANQYDGSRWAFSEGDRIVVVDALDKDARMLWTVGDFGGEIETMSIGSGLDFIVSPLQEVVSYTLPAMTCRSRVRFDSPTSPPLKKSYSAIGLSSDGSGIVGLVDVDTTPKGTTKSTVEVRSGRRLFSEFTLDAEAMPIGPVVFFRGEMVAIPCLDLGGASLRVHAVDSGVELAHLRFEGAHHVAVRETGQELVAFDDRGRIVRLNPDGPEVLSPTLVLRGI